MQIWESRRWRRRLILGVIIGGIAAWLRQGKHRRVARMHHSHVAALRREIDSLKGKVQERGFTLVPNRLYFKDGRAKVEVALAKGKDVRDRRREISKRESDRQIERALKQRSR